LLLAVLLWSKGEHPHATPADTPSAMAAPAVVAAPSVTAPVTQPPTVPQSQPATMPDNPPRTDPAASANAAARPAPAKEPSKGIERRLTPEAQIAAQPPSAGPPRSVTVERRPVVRSAPPPLDCTPQVDALGLCAPGAKVANQAGSR
jgi:hypothetical protein